MPDAPPLTWQPSLPVHPGPRPLRRIHLDDYSWVDHSPAWCPGADELFGHLATGLDWSEDERPMYERIVTVPRLTAPIPDGHPLRPLVAPLARQLSERYATTMDRVWCNLYRDGRDSVAWHGDRIRHVARDPLVAIVSLGEPRRFLIRPRGGGRSRRFDLGAGDLLVMGGACQHDHEHCVPKVASAGPRLSVTFRHSDA